MEIDIVPRTIHYYYLDFVPHLELEPTEKKLGNQLLKMVHALSKTRANIRYQNFGEKSIFIHDIAFVGEGKQITAKLRCIRKDLLPEIMNTKTDEAREIDAKEEEGLVETTHIVLDLATDKIKLAIEYNQFGAKINDLILYLKAIGQVKKICSDVGFIPVVKDNLKSIQSRIRKCSEFSAKVHKDNVEKIKTMDSNVYSALKASMEHFNSDFATVILKFDYKQRTETNEVNKSVRNLVQSLISKKSNIDLFNKLEVRAEDSEKNNLLETFDLLMDKVKSELRVQKRPRYRAIISQDILGKMQNSIHTKRI